MILCDDAESQALYEQAQQVTAEFHALQALIRSSSQRLRITLDHTRSLREEQLARGDDRLCRRALRASTIPAAP